VDLLLKEKSMALPIIATPKYELTVPSTGKKINYRPFLVKEEKVLLLANETKDQKQIITAMRDIITNCTFGEVDVKTLATFDIEYIFMQLRARSIGETIEVKVKCKKCGTENPLTVNTNDIKIKKDSNIQNNIRVGGNTGIIFNYPNFEALQHLESTNSNNNAQKTEELLTFMASCIETIYDEKQVYPAKDHTTKELVEFLESLPQVSFTKIMEFFNKMPYMHYSTTIKCSKCGHEEEVELKGAQDFFQSA
jgi:hypothetical protein